MTEQWYLHKDGKQYGPYTWEELAAFAREERVLPDDSVWSSSTAGWVAAREVAGLITPLSAAAPQGEKAPDQTPERGEEILGLIPALKKKTGLFSSKMYTLVVTERRLIFAELTGKMMQTAVAEANEASRGKGFFARMKETATSQQRIYEGYLRRTGEEILRENPENFAVENSEIKTVRVRLGHYHVDRENRQSDELIIQTAQGKIKLFFHYDNRTGEAKKVLWCALGERVK